MAVSDPIADMLTSIRNAGMARIVQASSPYSKIKEQILIVLLEEGYIHSYEVQGEGVKKKLAISLKYHANSHVIKVLKRVSKPGLRVYKKSSELDGFRNGLGSVLLSTSKGILPDYKARELSVGGEVICNIY